MKLSEIPKHKDVDDEGENWENDVKCQNNNEWIEKDARDKPAEDKPHTDISFVEMNEKETEDNVERENQSYAEYVMS